MDEVELMRRVAQGDREAATKFVNLHYESIFRLTRHLSGSRDDAFDLTQEVFLTVRSKAGSYRGESSLRTWLTRIAVNHYLKYRRGARLRKMFDFAVPPPSSRVDQMVELEWLTQGLARLRSEHRIALLLHEVQGLSVKEIAAVTESPEGTVKARLHFARKRLREILICPDGDSK